MAGASQPGQTSLSANGETTYDHDTPETTDTPMPRGLIAQTRAHGFLLGVLKVSRLDALVSEGIRFSKANRMTGRPYVSITLSGVVVPQKRMDRV